MNKTEDFKFSTTEQLPVIFQIRLNFNVLTSALKLIYFNILDISLNAVACIIQPSMGLPSYYIH